MHSRNNKQEEQQALSSFPTSTLPVGFRPEEFCIMDGEQRNKSMNLRDVNQQTRRDRKIALCFFFSVKFRFSHILSFYFSFLYFCSSHTFRSSTSCLCVSCRFDYLNQPSLTQGFRTNKQDITEKHGWLSTRRNACVRQTEPSRIGKVPGCNNTQNSNGRMWDPPLFHSHTETGLKS